MPSSTSSSDTRVPNIHYRSLLIYAAVAFLVILAACESFFRMEGHPPNVNDSERVWSLTRDEVYGGEQTALAVVGASRAQLGIVPEVLDAELPDVKTVMLAIDGTPGYAVVMDLCEDEDFNGVILWSCTVPTMFPAAEGQSRNDDKYAEFYRNGFRSAASIERNINALIGRELQARLVVLSSNLRLRSLLRAKFNVSPSYISMQANRYRPARYFSIMSDDERAEHRRKRIEKVISYDDARVDLAAFTDFVETELPRLREKLTARGGQLILLRMPTTAESWTHGQAIYPKESFWDRIEPLSGVPTIHFLDHPELRGLECPDTSHLDATDAPVFTRGLADVLRPMLPTKLPDPAWRC